MAWEDRKVRAPHEKRRRALPLLTRALLCAGGFVLRSRPSFYVPDMTGFRLKPYVWPGEGLAKPGVLETPDE